MKCHCFANDFSSPKTENTNVFFPLNVTIIIKSMSVTLHLSINLDSDVSLNIFRDITINVKKTFSN